MTVEFVLLRVSKSLALALLAMAPLSGITYEFGSEYNPLAKAFRAGDLKGVQNVLESKDPAVVADYPPEIIPDALAEAIAAGHIDILRYLESRGWFAYCKTHPECAPIHFAAMYGRVSVFEFFVSRGFDIRAIAFESRDSALHIAARQGQLKVVKFLCARGLDSNLKNGRGRTPLEEAKLSSKAVNANPRENARRRDRLARVIAYLESGQCDTK